MTSQPGPAPNGATQPSQITGPLREPAALVLLGANALVLFAGLINLMIPRFDNDTFGLRAYEVGTNYLVGLPAILLPVLAVLLATHLQPPVRRARLVTIVALAEYAAGALLGLIAFFGWFIGSFSGRTFGGVFSGLLIWAAQLAMLAVAAVVVFRIWRVLYYVPKPKAQPGVYGQPQPHIPGGHPQGYGQPGYPAGQPTAYGQPAGYPASQPGQPTAYGQPGQPTAYGQPAGYPPPAGYGQPAGYSAHSTGQPGYPTGTPDAAFQSPAAGTSYGLPAQSSAPPAAIPGSEATQAIPGGPDDGAGERTQLIMPASRQSSIGTVPPQSDTGDDPTGSQRR